MMDELKFRRLERRLELLEARLQHTNDALMQTLDILAKNFGREAAILRGEKAAE